MEPLSPGRSSLSGRHRHRWCAIAIVLLAATGLSAQSPAYVPGEVLIKYRPGAGKAAAAAGATVGATPIRVFNELGILQMAVDPSMDMSRVLETLQADPSCEFVEPNYMIRAYAAPNDPMYSSLWGLNNTGQTGGTADADMDALEAWAQETGSNSVVVGIFDTGIQYDHPDLAGNMWTNPGETAGNGIDDDGNGYIDDVYGWDFVNNDNDPYDDHSHGTHVAGTVGAVGNNGTGVTGVAWSVKLAALKILGADGSGNTADAVAAMNYAVGKGIKISNHSWGGTGYSSALDAAFQTAATNGMLALCAAGNDAANNDAIPHYPANFTAANVVSVAATDHNDNLAGFSDYGATTVDLAAPGVSILSTVPGSNYGYMQGTSMATPQVSGVAALVWSADPGLTYQEVKTLLLDSVDPIASLSGLMVTGGRVNALNALPGPRALLSATSLDFGNVALGAGNTKTLELIVRNPGTGTLTVSNVALSGTGASAYSHDAPGTPFTIAVDAEVTVQVTFDPDEANPGTRTATLTFTHDGSSGSDAVSLTGDGAIPVSVGAISFGGVATGSSQSRSITLDNPAGAAAITITNVTISGPFSHDAPATPFAINGGTSQTISVTYRASSPGLRTGSLSITHNPTIVIPLTAGSSLTAADGEQSGFTTTKTYTGVPFGGEVFTFLLAGITGLWALRRRGSP